MPAIQSKTRSIQHYKTFADASTAEQDSPSRRRIAVSVVLPCLNEAETLAFCINEIRENIQPNGLQFEIIVSDNGSDDRSVEIARILNVTVVKSSPKGYGVALRAGIAAAKSDFVVMGDADGSYNFRDILKFIEKLENGSDLVVGNRFLGGIQLGAMPWSHRWIGNPVLSFLGRSLFRCPIGDFHCGLRAIRKSRFAKVPLRSAGMEFASEMIVRAKLAGLKIDEVATTLRPDGRSRPPHLRSIRDGWRHLQFLFLLCPRWLFKAPGWILVFVGVTLQLLLMKDGGMAVAGIYLSLNTSLGAAISIILGVQLIGTGYTVERVAIILDPGSRCCRLQMRIGGGVLIGVGTMMIGIASFVAAALQWASVDFGNLRIELAIRQTVPALVLIAVGSQVMITALLHGSVALLVPAGEKNESLDESVGAEL